jgi:hypothetical protein
MVSRRKKMNYTKPFKTYSPNDLVKDSGLWDYLQYKQLDRVAWLSSTIWDSRPDAANKILNIISAIDTLEFLVSNKINSQKERKELYEKQKPLMFKEMAKNPAPLRQYIEGDPYKQLQMKLLISQWLRALDPALASMKRIKRVNVVAGEGLANPDEVEEE